MRGREFVGPRAPQGSRQQAEGWLSLEILDSRWLGLKKKLPSLSGSPEAATVSYNSVANLLAKPYPDMQAVANTYELCCMKDPMAKEVSPIALWDVHYLRDLDSTGFIDGLYQ